MFKCFLPFYVLVVLVITPTGADSRGVITSCVTAKGALEKLKRDHFEKQIASGIAEDGTLVIVVGKQDMSTWTILLVNKTGKICTLIPGHDWNNFSAWDALT